MDTFSSERATPQRSVPCGLSALTDPMDALWHGRYHPHLIPKEFANLPRHVPLSMERTCSAHSCQPPLGPCCWSLSPPSIGRTHLRPRLEQLFRDARY